MSQRSSRKLGEPPTLNKTETPPTRRSKASLNQQPQQKIPAQHVYRVGDKVLCLHKGSLYYEAKIQSESVLDSGERAFLVHYQGWNNRYDENIPFSEIHNRFTVYTNEAAVGAKQAQKEAAGGSGKKKSRASNALDSSKVSGTPTATSSRSSTPFESNKRRPPRDSSVVDSGGKRARTQPTKQGDNNSPLSTLVPASQVGLLGQSVASALAQQANIPTRKLPENFLENFPRIFCKILRFDQENIHKGRLPLLPARFSIDEIVGDYKESLGPADIDSVMHVEYGPNDSLEQTTPAFLTLSAEGIMDCFDNFVRTDLLYKVEWDSHDKKFKPPVLSDEKPKKGSDKGLQAENQPRKHYGVIHLLRLLSKFNTLLERLHLQRDLRYSSHANVQDFVAFLAKNIKKYYLAEEDFK